MRIKTLITLLIIWISSPSVAQLNPGSQFPIDISLDPLPGFPALQLKETKGKIAILDFWASWCEPCRVELPMLEKVSKKFSARDVVFITINLDENAKDAEKFLKSMQIKAPVVRDADRSLTSKVGINSLPVSVVLDRTGKVAKAFFGYSKGDEKRIEDLVQDLLKSK